MDSTQSLVQINLYQSQIHPRRRGFVRESRAPGGAQCRAGRRATAGREVGRGVRRAAGQVSRDRLNLGRTVVALAGCGPGPVSVAVARWRARRRRASSTVSGASGGCGRAAGHTVAHSGGRHAAAVGGSDASPATARTVQRSTTRAVVSASLILAPVARSCDDSRPRRAVGRASRRRRRRAPDGGAHGTPKGTRPARIPEEDRARAAGTWLVLEDLSLVQFELYRGGGQNLHPP